MDDPIRRQAGFKMKTSPNAAADRFEQAAWRRRCDADEAHWESQIRKMAGHAAEESRPSATGGSAAIRTALEVAAGVTRRDALFMPRTLPTFSGHENEDLVCGKCGDVIGFRISPVTARREHPEGERLVVRCTCGALNVLSR
ncbi:MAG: hypothetical protein QOG72_348 [Sphingomonadales bacterium]|jgi:hypothetical protein|nr:hypothetical protein [Sphingomonadales bacterium]